MRWGVRDDATNTHMTTELCLREIKACQEISVGPNFVVGAATLNVNYIRTDRLIICMHGGLLNVCVLLDRHCSPRSMVTVPCCPLLMLRNLSYSLGLPQMSRLGSF